MIHESGEQMEAVGSRVDLGLLMLLALVYITSQLTEWVSFQVALGVLVVLVIVKFLTVSRGITLFLSLLFLVCGAAILLHLHVPLITWSKVLSLNVAIVMLFVFAPLFGIPVRSRRYADALQEMYRSHIRKKNSFFLGTQLLTHLLGVVLNIGTVSVVYDLASVNPRVRSKRLLAAALNRGYTTSLYWSPYFAAMALVTSNLGVAWVQLFPYAIGFVWISFTVSFLIEWANAKRTVGEEAVETELLFDDRNGSAVEELATAARPETMRPPSPVSMRPIGHLAFYLLSATVFVLLPETFLSLPIVIIICFVSVLYPLIWCRLTGSLADYREGLHRHVHVSLPGLRKEIVLFLAAGFFSGAIGQSQVGDYVPELLAFFHGAAAVWFSVFTLLLALITALLGIHPIILMTILILGVNPASIGMTPLHFALLLLGSWGISNTISPATAVNNLLSVFLQVDVFRLSIRWNLAYSLILSALLPIYLFFCQV
ncbi:hypothetical protein [Effusibacillus dendaii]|uniref:Citrate transporter-like domain-containing protein n=1 Tax=Effusibacillus dendaii TaxID=2743772 RepID=A0A7I8DDU5_9BACL|nr:hypothetical protein [Effusibacillus dendaii]BCJ86690.1 hypothetical protein skT53_16750 [Effusibacillus dendaii]